MRQKRNNARLKIAELSQVIAQSDHKVRLFSAELDRALACRAKEMDSEVIHGM